MKLLIKLLIQTLAIFAAAQILPQVTVPDLSTALLVAVILGLVNATIKPLIGFFTLPLNLLTFGMFSLVINAVLVLLVDYFVPGFDVGGFIPAFLFSIIVSLITTVMYRFFE